MRKRCRRVVRSDMPQWLRPKLAAPQVADLALVHIQVLDDIVHGRGTEPALWDLAGAACTWSFVAQLLPHAQVLVKRNGEWTRIPATEAMGGLLRVVSATVERYGRTGRIGFTGTDYQVAKEAVDVMDQLAERTDRDTAVQAANMSEDMTNELSARIAAERSQQGATA